MIALVPRFYPDELIYSFCARYHERMGYRSRESTGRDLFGKTGARVAVAFDFPSGLKTLAAASRWDDGKTADQMIDSHTLLPFYAPFVSPHILSRAREGMTGAGGGTIHGTLGVLTHNIRLEHFRYCSRCAESDRSKFGEAYWHRLHQLPGIEVCPIHKIFLSETALRTRHRPNAEVFVTAEKVLEMGAANSVRSVEISDKVHLRLSQDAKWLMDAGISVGSNSNNQQRYLELLYAQGFSGYDGQVRLKVLIRELRHHYSEELLDHFNCSLGNSHNWITRLIHGMNQSQNPIEHLLLIQFLGVSVAEFFKLSSMRLPFGNGPWPCLNPTCERFRQPALKQYEKSQTRKLNPRKGTERKKMGHPIATFSCTCGFSYFRIGPDKSKKSSYQATGFSRVTQPWIASFTRSARENRQLSRLANQFCTTPETVKLMLKQIDGVLPTNKPRVAVAGEDTAPTTRFLQQRKAKRDRWLKHLSTNQSLPRGKFCKAKSHDYRWLVLNDKKWLGRHLPPRLYSKGPGFRTDWKEKDKVMSDQVRKEAERIRSMPGKLTRASKTIIAQNLQNLHLVIKRGHLVPLTIRALSEEAETVEEFAIRRIRHQAQLLREQGIRASKWKLQLLAAINNDVARRPTVRHTLELYATA